MSEFVDRVLLQLSDPTQVVQLLAPATDSATWPDTFGRGSG